MQLVILSMAPAGDHLFNAEMNTTNSHAVDPSCVQRVCPLYSTLQWPKYKPAPQTLSLYSQGNQHVAPRGTQRSISYACRKVVSPCAKANLKNIFMQTMSHPLCVVPRNLCAETNTVNSHAVHQGILQSSQAFSCLLRCRVPCRPWL